MLEGQWVYGRRHVFFKRNVFDWLKSRICRSPHKIFKLTLLENDLSVFSNIVHMRDVNM